MRKILFLIFIFFISAGAYTKVLESNPYTQLIGFKGGGEYLFGTQMTGWSGGVFFENVIDSLIGIEIEMIKSDIPITNYSSLSKTTIYGLGNKEYIEISTALKFYIQKVSVNVGLTYNDFLGGNIIYSNYIYYQDLRDNGESFLSVFTGVELVAQISSDLFSKIWIRFLYGIISPYWVNYATGLRFYVSFAYGI